MNRRPIYPDWLGLSGVRVKRIPLERDLRLAALTNNNYHAAQLSCAMSAEAVRRAKDLGAKVTAGAYRSTICRSMKTTLVNSARFPTFATFARRTGSPCYGRAVEERHHRYCRFGS